MEVDEVYKIDFWTLLTELDLDIYHGVHFHTNKFGIGKRSKWIKAHHWMFAPIGIGIGVGLSDGWSEW